MNADLRCFLVVVLLLALMGCGSDSMPPAGNDTTATLDRDAIKDQVDATTQEDGSIPNTEKDR